MTDNLNEAQVKILTWVVYALLLILTGVTAWQQVQFVHMPDKYVRLERYKCDQDKIETKLNRIDSNIMKLLEARNK